MSTIPWHAVHCLAAKHAGTVLCIQYVQVPGGSLLIDVDKHSEHLKPSAPPVTITTRSCFPLPLNQLQNVSGLQSNSTSLLENASLAVYPE